METLNNDLIYNVAQLLKENVGSIRKLPVRTERLTLAEEGAHGSEIPGQQERIEANNVEGNVKVTRVSADLLVQGDVAADVTLQCSRCLDEFVLPVNGQLEETFQPSIDIETGRAVVRPEEELEDTAFEINASHEIDLSEPVRQALLVALPMRPLCSEECAGLCPQCGANWNEGPCDCPQETADSRWDALRELTVEDLPTGEISSN